MERINTYEKWLQKEGLPVIREYSVLDLMAVPLKPWVRRGGLGAYINLIGFEGVVDAYVCEIPPGRTLLPQRQLFEEMIYILSGAGQTTLWNGDNLKRSFGWHEGSLFSPPLNTFHQHANTQGDKPVRFLAVTRAPVMMNLFHDLDFVLNNDYQFKSRYNGEQDYFSNRVIPLDLPDDADNARTWQTNFVPDCRTVPLVYNPERSRFSSIRRFEMSNGMMHTHLGELAGGSYTKAHYHGAGAPHLYLSGQGYALAWPADAGVNAVGVQRVRMDMQKYSLYAAPDRWFDQRFSTGKEPARYLAFHADSNSRYVGINKDHKGTTSVRLGGTQIEHEDEDPAIRRSFKEELSRTGASWLMSQYFPGDK